MVCYFSTKWGGEMSEDLRRLIGQIMICGFPSAFPDDAVRELIRQYHVGNIILFARNIVESDQISQLTKQLQQIASDDGQRVPMLIATDQENGMVRRLGPNFPGFPGNMAMVATGDEHLVYEVGKMTGEFLDVAGINMNLSPVLDVNNNPLNPVIGTRSFGDDPKQVARMGVALMKGLQASGIVPCGKHFPGHGDTHVDSHCALPHIGHDLRRIRETELIPFERAIREGLPVIMTAHIVFDQLDPMAPATLSKRVLQGLLREDLGFSGVIATDCLEMQAILGTTGVGEGAVRALAAGADMVMVSHRREWQIQAINAVYDAVCQGRLPLSRLEDANSRVAAIKSRLHHRLQADKDDGETREKKALNLRQNTSQRALTCLIPKTDPDRDIFPVPKTIMLIEDTPPSVLGGEKEEFEPVIAILASRFPGVKIDRLGRDDPVKESDVMRHDWLLYVVSSIPSALRGDIPRLLERHPHSVVWLVSTPYALPRISMAKRVYALYERTQWMATAALDALLGQNGGGSLPIDVEDYPRGYQGCRPKTVSVDSDGTP